MPKYNWSDIYLVDAEDALKNKFDKLNGEPIKTDGYLGPKKPIWSPQFFHIEESNYFNTLGSSQREEVLANCAELILKEAIAIEHAGIFFGHKMALLAKTEQERHFYTHLASEELNHLNLLRSQGASCNFSDKPSIAQGLASLIENEDRVFLILLVQIVLEGWGINYFKGLVDFTDNEDIKNVFKQILNDEYKHHAGGLVLYKNEKPTLTENDMKKLQILIDELKLGPSNVASILCSHNKIRDLETITDVINSIGGVQTSADSLNLIRRLLCKVFGANEIATLNMNPPTSMQLAERAKLQIASECEK